MIGYYAWIFATSNYNVDSYPGQSRPAVNGRIPIIYDGKRPPFTVTPYGSHIRCFTVYYAHRKQSP